jgi:hypothetical protein
LQAAGALIFRVMVSLFHYLGVVEFEHGVVAGGRPEEHPVSKQPAEANASTTATAEEESRSVEERIIDQVLIKFIFVQLTVSECRLPSAELHLDSSYLCINIIDLNICE